MLTTERPVSPLIERLTALQGDAPDREVAERLGISRGHWTHLYAGRRSLTARTIQAIRRAYPELEGECIAALLRLGERS